MTDPLNARIASNSLCHAVFGAVMHYAAKLCQN